MDKKRKFSKKALRDFDLIDAAIARNDQSAFAELMATYKNSIYWLKKLKILKDLGVTQFNIYLDSGDEERIIAEYGENVIPAFS